MSKTSLTFFHSSHHVDRHNLLVYTHYVHHRDGEKLYALWKLASWLVSYKPTFELCGLISQHNSMGDDYVTNV